MIKPSVALKLFSLVIVVFCFAALVHAPKSSALSGNDFQAGHIIDDGVFKNSAAMTVQEIQNFLNSKLTSCDTNGSITRSYYYNSSTGRINNSSDSWVTTSRAVYGQRYDAYKATTIAAAPYTCLKSYMENPGTGQNNLQGNPCPTNTGCISAAQIIWNVAFSFNINPEVLITTLQKEQGLVTDDWPWVNEYQAAMGYACPDNGQGCNSIYAGFYTQLYSAAWQFDYYFAHPGAFNYWTGSNFIQYNPDGNCGGSIVNIVNPATAALYIYTPYQPNAASLVGVNDSTPGGTANCGAYGNRNFWWYFNEWFGASLTSSWDYSYVTSSNPTINLQPGQTIQNNSITIKNSGTATWYADGSVPTGQHPVRLAIRGYNNIPFADPDDTNWLATANQIKMTPATVAPGENATFTFNLTGPMHVYPFRYVYFVPVVDGITFMRDVGMGFGVTNQSPPYSFVSQQSIPNPLLPNQLATGSVTIQNTGSVTWHADGSVPAGQHSLRLAVRGYEKIPFIDYSDTNWLGTANQIKMTPATVAPGENATFTFNVVGPLRSLSRSLFFVPVLDGVTFMSDKNIGMGINTPQPAASYQYVTATNPPSTIQVGTTANASLTIKNTGNIVWQPESFSGPGKIRLRLMMKQPSYHNSMFYDSSLGSSWIVPSQIKYTGPTVMPGQSATFTFTWKAPPSTGSYVDYFAPVLDGLYEYPDIGMGFAVNVTP